MATTFNYNIAAFPLGVVDTTQLWIEIAESSIVPNLTDICRLGDTVTIQFDSDLSVAEEAILNGIVATHQGTEPEVQEAEFIGSNRDPTVNDDDSRGAALGTRWFNTTTNQLFICLDPTDGAAVWKHVVGEDDHETLRQLIHFINDGPATGFPSGSYKETTPTGPFPTSEVWYESSAKLKKIVSLDTTWSGAKIIQEIWRIYDTDGTTVLHTITDVISHSGVFETNRTRTMT